MIHPSILQFFSPLYHAYQRGIAEGARRAARERNSLVTFDFEYAYLTGAQSVSKEDEEVIRGIVNAPSYDSLRLWLLFQVLNFYRDARSTKDANCMAVLVNIGNALNDLIHRLDQFKEQPKGEEEHDPYSV